MEDGGGFYKFKDQALNMPLILGFTGRMNVWLSSRIFKSDGMLIEDESYEVYDSKANAENHDGSTGLILKVRNQYTWDSKSRLATMLTTEEA